MVDWISNSNSLCFLVSLSLLYNFELPSTKRVITSLLFDCGSLCVTCFCPQNIAQATGSQFQASVIRQLMKLASSLLSCQCHEEFFTWVASAHSAWAPGWIHMEPTRSQAMGKSQAQLDAEPPAELDQPQPTYRGKRNKWCCHMSLAVGG